MGGHVFQDDMPYRSVCLKLNVCVVPFGVNFMASYLLLFKLFSHIEFSDRYFFQHSQEKVLYK